MYSYRISADTTQRATPTLRVHAPNQTVKRGYERARLRNETDQLKENSAPAPLVPGVEFLRLSLFRALEMIVGLQQKEPGALAVAHGAGALQILFGSMPQRIDIFHDQSPD